MILPRNACFLCALCGNVTAFFFSAPKYIVQNPLWQIQVFPEFINIMIENNPLHKSGAKSTLYIVALEVFRYCRTFLFVIIFFVLPWRYVRSQLQCIYPYLVMTLEIDPKLPVSCGTLLLNLKSDWSTTKCHHNFHLNICHCQTFLP